MYRYRTPRAFTLPRMNKKKPRRERERERERHAKAVCFMEKMLRAVRAQFEVVHRYYLRIVRAQAIDVTKLRNRLATTNCYPWKLKH